MILAAHALGEGAPVALLHGLFGSARNLGQVHRALAARFRVIAIDLRNHGDSPHAATMDYPAMAADVRETLQAQDALPAGVMGHSMGGKVAMRLALHDPGVVSRLAVADIAPVPYPSHFGGYVEAMRAVPRELSRTEADAALAPAIDDPRIRGFLLHNWRPGAGWRIGLDAIGACLPRIEAWDTLGEPPYAGPALFIAGAKSDYVLPAYRPAIRAQFPAAKFATIKDAGHWLHAEQPAAFIATLGAFFGAGQAA